MATLSSFVAQVHCATYLNSTAPPQVALVVVHRSKRQIYMQPSREAKLCETPNEAAKDLLYSLLCHLVLLQSMQ